MCEMRLSASLSPFLIRGASHKNKKPWPPRRLFCAHKKPHPAFDLERVFGFKLLKYNGRGERIRTSDPLVPNQVLYQAEPLPELAVGRMFTS
jgi:hypothetical protein